MSDASGNLPTIDPEATYDVVIRAPMVVAGHEFLPLHEHEVSGAFLQRMIDEKGAVNVESAIKR